MIYYRCDTCLKVQDYSPVISLKGEFTYKDKRGGILLPRNEFHFCSMSCYVKFLNDTLMFDKEK